VSKFEVTPAVQYKIPKDSGGFREIVVFSIPDAAIANLFNAKLRDRNRNLQSPFCYSYRKDRNLFDAVLDLSSTLGHGKTYIIQYDFAKYFDSIRHEYLSYLLEQRIFSLSDTEKYIINCFLRHRFASRANYGEKNFSKRARGVPQGCSLSLFLSNIAAHELDRKLEAANGRFVRFADDIVSVTRQFDDALAVKRHFEGHCVYSGIQINKEKSPGINLFGSSAGPKISADEDAREFFVDQSDLGRIVTINSFDYLGHKFSRDQVQMSTRAIKRIKIRIGRIIYIHLLRHPKKQQFNRDRIGDAFYDWDFVTRINEIRNYIYGGLREDDIEKFIQRNDRISRFRGLMSFYPLVTSVEQLAELDGWLVSVLRRATKERSRILREFLNVEVAPLNEQQILDGTWYKYQKKLEMETRAPSFVRGWRAARKAYRQYGLSDFEAPSYYSALHSLY